MNLTPEYIPVIDQTISFLEDDVRQAPLLSRLRKFERYQAWKKHEYLKPMLHEDFSLVREPYKSAIEMLAVGVVGLGRLYFQDVITLFRPWATVLNSELDQQRRDMVKAENIQQSLNDFPLYRLPPWTIEHQAVDWFGEVGQLIVEMLIRVGDLEKAYGTLESLEITMSQRWAKIAATEPDWHLPDKVLAARKPDEYRLRQDHRGKLAAQAMLAIHRARILKDFHSWQNAFAAVKESLHRTPDPEMIQLAKFERAKSNAQYPEAFTLSQTFDIFRQAPRIWLSLHWKKRSSKWKDPTISLK